MFPVYLRSRTIVQIPTLPSLKRFKSFGHLSNHLKKTRMGSHHSEKIEFLRQILRKKPIFVIGNSNQPSHVKTTLTRPRKGSFCSMGDITVDPKGVAKLLDGLNVHKASGPDGLNARVLKECSNEISPILALIYNESLARGEVPDEWRQANVSPVFKKGEKYDAANYRPVSLTCICCKTLEHILVSNINKHLALDSILADCQHGFRSQRSCETQLVQFVHDIISNLDGAVNRGHKQTDLIIMDFAKAFDKVPHRRLLHKLEYYGIRGSIHKWINSWLSGRTQQVVLARWPSLRSSPSANRCPGIGPRSGPVPHLHK